MSASVIAATIMDRPAKRLRKQARASQDRKEHRRDRGGRDFHRRRRHEAGKGPRGRGNTDDRVR